MYTSNNKVITKLPNLISTIGDIPEQTKTVYTPYGNKFSVLNLGYQFSNPLILPIDVTVDFIVYGNISLSSNVIKSDTFTIVTEYGNKFAISGDGTVLIWYRYGRIDPASFNLIMQYALQQNDYVLVDALLHTLSIQEAISYVLQNPAVQEALLKGLDWQLNKIGFKDFLAYINGGRYDVRHLAFFLTIASYLFPCVFAYSGIPQFTGKPLEVYIKYLLYLAEYGQVVTSELEYQSEVLVYHQSEIDLLFEQTSELSETTAYQQSEIELLFEQTASLSESVNTLETEVAVLFVESMIHQSEINNLSEELVSEQSEITALSEYTSECCTNVLIQLGKVLTDLLKIIGVVYQLVKAIGSEGGLNVSELDSALSSVVTDVTESLEDLVGVVNYLFPNSPIISDLQEDISEVGTIVNNLLGGLLGNLVNVSTSESTQTNSESNSFGFNFNF